MDKMIPPKEINVLDKHDGFTAITTKNNDTLWRSKFILFHKKEFDFTGILQSYKEDSFYQSNNDVTMAVYKVKGYRYPIALWFDNKTAERIA